MRDCICGARYDAFRAVDESGRPHTYASVHASLGAGHDPLFWNNRSRAAVLRHWGWIKRAQWGEVHHYCEAAAAEQDRQAAAVAAIAALPDPAWVTEGTEAAPEAAGARHAAPLALVRTRPAGLPCRARVARSARTGYLSSPRDLRYQGARQLAPPQEIDTRHQIAA